MVNRSARRFVNEAVNYNALGFALHNFDADTYEFPNLPYWLDLRQPLHRQVPDVHEPSR